MNYNVRLSHIEQWMMEPTVFPEEAIEASIRDALRDALDDQSTLLGVESPPLTADGSSDGPVDSLAVVASLVAIEEHVPFKVPERVVRPGGYNDIDDAVASLINEVQRIWTHHHDEVMA